MSPRPEEMVALAELENEMEAQFLSALLEEAGVAHRIRVYHDRATGGMLSINRPWGAVEARLQRRNTVLSMLKAVREGSPGDETSPDPVPVDAF